MRAFALLAARAALVAGPVVLAFFSGGFFDGPRDVALLITGVVLGVAALAAPHAVVPEHPAARVALVAATAYAGWIALSATWAPVSDFAGDDAAAVPLGMGCYLSFSRGALAALAAGLLTVVVLAHTWAQLRAALTVAAAGAAGALAAAASPAVRALEGSMAAREREGAIVLAVAVALM